VLGDVPKFCDLRCLIIAAEENEKFLLLFGKGEGFPHGPGDLGFENAEAGFLLCG